MKRHSKASPSRKAPRGWRSTYRGHVLMYLTGEVQKQTGKPGLLAAQRILKVKKKKKRIRSYLYDVFHLKGREGLLVSCAYSGFTFNLSNVQTHEISSLNEWKVTLGIKEANGSLHGGFFTGLEIYPAPEHTASSNRQGYIYF